MELARRGPAVNDVDPAPFGRKLSGVYLKWKKQLGSGVIRSVPPQ